MKGLAAQTDTYVAMDLTEPRIDYLQLAAGLGLKALKANTLEDLRDHLATALETGGAVLIDVEIDRSYKPV